MNQKRLANNCLLLVNGEIWPPTEDNEQRNTPPPSLDSVVIVVTHAKMMDTGLPRIYLEP